MDTSGTGSSESAGTIIRTAAPSHGFTSSSATDSREGIMFPVIPSGGFENRSSSTHDDHWGGPEGGPPPHGRPHGPPPNDANDGLNGAEIAGIIFAIAGVLFVYIALFLWYKKLEKKNRESNHDHENRGVASDLEAGQHTRASVTAAETPVLGAFYGVGSTPSDRRKKTAQTINPQNERGVWEDPVILTLRVSMQDVQTDVLLHQGRSGEVYRGRYHSEVVAIKKLAPRAKTNLKEIELLLSEAKLRAEVAGHPHIVNVIGVAWEALSSVCVLSTYQVRGDLARYLAQYESTTGFGLAKLKIALQISDALVYLHALSPTVLHRDLKASHVLLNDQLDAKLTGFTVAPSSENKVALDIDEDGSGAIITPIEVGTVRWMAPEVMIGGEFTWAADMFAFGMLLSELATHAAPFTNVRNPETGEILPAVEVLNLVLEGQVTADFPQPSTPLEIVALGRACTSLDPKVRPTASQARTQLQQLLGTYAY